jgi:hypothetical protein
MNIENRDQQDEDEEEEIDWLDYASQEEEQALPPLEGKDYLALFIASLQTIFLPLIILIIVLLATSVVLQIAAGG